MDVVLSGATTTNSELSPVVDASLQDLLQEDFHSNVRKVLRYWVDVDMANLHRLKTGIQSFVMPYEYRANEEGGGGAVIQGTNRAESLESVESNLKEVVAHYSQQIFKKGDLPGATRCAMLLRYLFKEDVSCATHDFFLHGEISKTVKGPMSCMFMGVDALNAEIDRMLSGKQPRRMSTSKKATPKKKVTAKKKGTAKDVKKMDEPKKATPKQLGQAKAAKKAKRTTT